MPEKWVDPVISRDLVVHGGLSTAPIVVEPKHIMELSVQGKRSTFVKMSKQDKWFFKTIKGDAGLKGGMVDITILDDIKKKIENAGNEPNFHILGAQK